MCVRMSLLQLHCSTAHPGPLSASQLNSGQHQQTSLENKWARTDLWCEFSAVWSTLKSAAQVDRCAQRSEVRMKWGLDPPFYWQCSPAPLLRAGVRSPPPAHTMCRSRIERIIKFNNIIQRHHWIFLCRPRRRGIEFQKGKKYVCAVFSALIWYLTLTCLLQAQMVNKSCSCSTDFMLYDFYGRLHFFLLCSVIAFSGWSADLTEHLKVCHVL